MVVDEIVSQCGAKLYKTPVGDIKISLKLKEISGDFGGESCGVYIWPAIHYGPDSLVAAGKLLEILCVTNKRLSELLSEIPSYPISRTSVNCPNEIKTQIMNYLENEIKCLSFIKKVDKIDGLNLELENGWAIIRPSGTEPLIRVTVEAKSKERVDEYLKSFSQLIKKALGNVST